MLAFTPYTFGTMSLGRNPASIKDDLAVARRAMEEGIWFHSSPTYNNGFTFMVLRLAFDADRAKVPRMIIKVRDADPSLMRFEVEDSCRRLGLESIDVVQLVSMDPGPGNLVDQLSRGSGPILDELAAIRSRGLIRQAVIYLTSRNSEAAVAAAAASKLVDGVTLYWNACQRDCTERAWGQIREQRLPVLALRTLGGGPADEHSRKKAADLETLIKASGCRNATEFNVRLATSEPAIRTTIGGTASLAHLEDYLVAARNPDPLPPAILDAVRELQVSR